MSSSFEKSVKGGTKVKLAPPKTKYVEHLLLGTQSGEAGVAEVFRTLTHRLRDSTWTVAFKSLILVHLMIKEGAPEVTLRYLAVAPQNRLAVNSFTDVQTQGHNIRKYSEYLLARSVAYEKTHVDFIRSGEDRMRRISVDKGLLRETEIIQHQIKALVKCDFFSNDPENEISLTAFRLLTSDLLGLFKVLNEAVMNVLRHYFEMSKPDAERAIKIYKSFCSQTDIVVQFLGIARRYEYATRLEIPKLKHAPTSLAASLQEYVDDKDFEVNRRQYLAEQEAKKDGKPSSKLVLSKPQSTSEKASAQVDTKAAPQLPSISSTKAPGADLLDFFDSLDMNQQVVETNPFLQKPQQQVQQQQLQQQQQMPQMTGYGMPQQSAEYQQQHMSGFQTGPIQSQFSQPPPQTQTQPLQTQFTGAGFGGYGPQPTQQTFTTSNGFTTSPSSYNTQSPAQLQPQITNPFRQSMMSSSTNSSFSSPVNAQQPQQLQHQNTNPFARPAPIPEDGVPASFTQPLQPQATGTNPFARQQHQQQQQGQPSSNLSPLQVQATGSTNPFRQSAFVNQQTGQGWQNTPQQTTMGGLEHLDTIPVFPRPGGQQQQQQGSSPWF